MHCTLSAHPALGHVPVFGSWFGVLRGTGDRRDMARGFGKVDALRKCLEQTMPAISREEAFFCTLFGLNPVKDPRARDATHRWTKPRCES